MTTTHPHDLTCLLLVTKHVLDIVHSTIFAVAGIKLLLPWTLDTVQQLSGIPCRKCVHTIKLKFNQHPPTQTSTKKQTQWALIQDCKHSLDTAGCCLQQNVVRTQKLKPMSDNLIVHQSSRFVQKPFRHIPSSPQEENVMCGWTVDLNNKMRRNWQLILFSHALWQPQNLLVWTSSSEKGNCVNTYHRSPPPYHRSSPSCHTYFPYMLFIHNTPGSTT